MFQLDQSGGTAPRPFRIALARSDPASGVYDYVWSATYHGRDVPERTTLRYGERQNSWQTDEGPERLQTGQSYRVWVDTTDQRHGIQDFRLDASLPSC